MFMCNDTITKPACKTQSANCAFEGDFVSWISVRQRGEERKSQVDVIDSHAILCLFFVCLLCEVCILVCTNTPALKLLELIVLAQC